MCPFVILCVGREVWKFTLLCVGDPCEFEGFVCGETGLVLYRILCWETGVN